MALHLLDADAVIDYAQEFATTVSQIEGLARAGHALGVSDVVLAEVYSGLEPPRVARTEALLARCQFLTTSLEASLQAGRWRHRFARQGVQLGVGDCLIAATAWQHNATLVTGNVRHYPMDEVTVLPLPRH